MMKKIILFSFLFCLGYPSGLRAQFDRGGAMSYENRAKHSAYFEMPFRLPGFGGKNYGDLALGGTYRHNINGNQFLGVFGSFYGRPYGKAVLVKAGPRFYFQAKEYRYVIAGGLDKKFWINNKLDLFIGAGIGVTFIDYRGTSSGIIDGHKLEKKEGWTPVVQAGFSHKFSRFVFIRSGLQYMNMRTIPGLRFYAALGGQF
ncbi:MAG TPA: hypothetical protein PLL93_05110 [bacterium]|nr:hypothetical protein [bacterium]HMZ04050.1 hypothetical protein [bacterium]HND75763.1 hypothetical protein [bacterium]HNI10499.1 hypothetical protein [bacterium]HNO10715.1 hypothetical protein [bacterium]